MKKLTLTMAGLFAGLLASSAIAHDGGPRGEKFHQKMEEHFKKADKDGDGAISKAEFLASAEERFAKMDVDGDGKLTQVDRDAAKKRWEERKAEKAKTAPKAE